MQTMNDIVTYEWSEELGRSAFMASYAAKGTRLWLLATAGIILTAVGWAAYISTRQPVALMAGVFGIIWVLLPLRIVMLYRRLAKDAKRLVDDPKVTIVIKDDAFTITSGKNSRTIEWGKTTEIADKNGFLLVYCGKLNVACFPKQYFSDSQIDFVKQRVQK